MVVEGQSLPLHRQVPPMTGAHQAVGVDVSDGGPGLPVAVGQPAAFAPAAGGGQLQQHSGGNLGFAESGGVHKCR
jgi:hypothetical protein